MNDMALRISIKAIAGFRHQAAMELPRPSHKKGAMIRSNSGFWYLIWPLASIAAWNAYSGAVNCLTMRGTTVSLLPAWWLAHKKFRLKRLSSALFDAFQCP
jgi:hypothetical protein